MNSPKLGGFGSQPGFLCDQVMFRVADGLLTEALDYISSTIEFRQWDSPSEPYSNTARICIVNIEVSPDEPPPTILIPAW